MDYGHTGNLDTQNIPDGEVFSSSIPDEFMPQENKDNPLREYNKDSSRAIGGHALDFYGDKNNRYKNTPDIQIENVPDGLVFSRYDQKNNLKTVNSGAADISPKTPTHTTLPVADTEPKQATLASGTTSHPAIIEHGQHLAEQAAHELGNGGISPAEFFDKIANLKAGSQPDGGDN